MWRGSARRGAGFGAARTTAAMVTIKPDVVTARRAAVVTGRFAPGVSACAAVIAAGVALHPARVEHVIIACAPQQHVARKAVVSNAALAQHACQLPCQTWSCAGADLPPALACFARVGVAGTPAPVRSAGPACERAALLLLGHALAVGAPGCLGLGMHAFGGGRGRAVCLRGRVVGVAPQMRRHGGRVVVHVCLPTGASCTAAWSTTGGVSDTGPRPPSKLEGAAGQEGNLNARWQELETDQGCRGQGVGPRRLGRRPTPGRGPVAAGATSSWARLRDGDLRLSQVHTHLGSELLKNPLQESDRRCNLQCNPRKFNAPSAEVERQHPNQQPLWSIQPPPGSQYTWLSKKFLTKPIHRR